MTSEDIKFTIDLRNKVPASRMIINCEVIDDFSFRFLFDKPISEIPTWKCIIQNIYWKTWIPRSITVGIFGYNQL